VARELGISVTTVGKWLARAATDGPAGLRDRSSRPHRCPRATPLATQATIVTLRRQRLPGRVIAQRVGRSPATVSRVLRRARLSRARDLAPPVPVIRYERATPGDLLHLDTKKLGRFTHPGHRATGQCAGQHRDRGIGYDLVHVAVDDHSRLAHATIRPDERGATAAAALRECVAWYARQGIQVQAVMTDNAPSYLSRAFRAACAELGVRHLRTRPYTPRTNGKAERFIRTALTEWAYGQSYPSSAARAEALAPWLTRYNHERPHQGIGGVAPASRIRHGDNNLLRVNS
jgi:transposase InsO family protein